MAGVQAAARGGDLGLAQAGQHLSLQRAYLVPVAVEQVPAAGRQRDDQPPAVRPVAVPIEWWTCNGGANQVWQAQNGELVNPHSGKCLDDPASNTPPGTQLILFTCNGGANQKWTLP